MPPPEAINHRTLSSQERKIGSTPVWTTWSVHLIGSKNAKGRESLVLSPISSTFTYRILISQIKNVGSNPAQTTMNAKERQLFKQFLKEHHAYNKFKKLVHLHFKCKDDPYALRKYLNTTSTYAVVGSAFTWFDSPEGYIFWSKLCDEWNKIQRSI